MTSKILGQGRFGRNLSGVYDDEFLFALECKLNVKGGITCLKLTLSKVCFFTFKEVSVFSSKIGIGLLRR